MTHRVTLIYDDIFDESLVCPHGSMVNFLFSSRRRHTRYWRDWNVCSSDLRFALRFGRGFMRSPLLVAELRAGLQHLLLQLLRSGMDGGEKVGVRPQAYQLMIVIIDRGF